MHASFSSLRLWYRLKRLRQITGKMIFYSKFYYKLHWHHNNEIKDCKWQQRESGQLSLLAPIKEKVDGATCWSTISLYNHLTYSFFATFIVFSLFSLVLNKLLFPEPCYLLIKQSKMLSRNHQYWNIVHRINSQWDN